MVRSRSYLLIWTRMAALFVFISLQSHASLLFESVDESFSVTLITGDRVTVTKTAQGNLILVQKDGLSVPAMIRETKDGGVTVIPEHAAELVASDMVDVRLFDIALLRRLEYHDEATTKMPIIGTGATLFSAIEQAQELKTLVHVRALKKLRMTTMDIAKDQAANFWHWYGIQTSKLNDSAKNGKTAKLWLVDKFKPTLEESRVQIGVDGAERLGYTGKGVIVAVVDTGYDPSHRDLQNVVVDSHDFTNSDVGVLDQNGHGTHVASIIAGRGTASDGRFLGVATGAQLAIGKVCTPQGYCGTDAILAAMEWSTSVGAKIVNLSLGSSMHVTDDPVTRAIEELTAVTNTLFVVAAGNEGRKFSINTPGSAAAALTVGSVDKTDALSQFSSRGPFTDPSFAEQFFVLKPDIVAPGENIVGARAAETGTPILNNDFYTALSGTSMSTPHVAGAAALLLEARPNSTPQKLKAMLMSSAKLPHQGDIFDFGAGRVSVDRAVAQAISTDTTSLNFGQFKWPHKSSSERSRTLRFRNDSADPITLTLTAFLADDEKNANDDMISLKQNTLVVPAHGISSTEVIFRAHGGKPGIYGGYIQALNLDKAISLITPVGAFVEPEIHDLKIHVSNTSERLVLASVALIEKKIGYIRDANLSTTDATTVLRVTPGSYVVLAQIVEKGAKYHFFAQEVEVKRDASVNFDLNASKKIGFSVDDETAVNYYDQRVALLFMAANNTVPGFILSGSMASFTQAAKIPGLRVVFNTNLNKEGTRPGGPISPFVYHLSAPYEDEIPEDPFLHVNEEELAVVDTAFFPYVDDYGVTHLEAFYWDLGDNEKMILSAQGFSIGGVHQQMHYFDRHFYTPFHFQGREDDVTDLHIFAKARQFKEGETTEENWGAPVYAPAFGFDDFLDDESYTYRKGNDILLALTPFSDGAPGHSGFGGQSNYYSSLKTGDVVIAEAEESVLRVQVPEAGARYQYTLVSNRFETDAPSSRIETTWDFYSAPSEGGEKEEIPLFMVRVLPPHEDPQKGEQLALPLHLERRVDKEQFELASITVEASFDGGSTWVPARIDDEEEGLFAVVDHPADVQWVALRIHASDTEGTTLAQTIINAYHVD